MRSLLRSAQQNWQSGITVALVSIPLSLSLAIASGAAPIAGIVTAVWAGIVAAIFSASAYNVVGPAGALSGILLAFSLQYGATALPMLAVVSGLGILLFWLLKWDRYLVFVPSSVMHGFTVGVALIIGLGQLNFALNLQGLPSHPHFLENLWETLTSVGSLHVPSVLLTLATMAILFGLVRFAPRIPGAIVVAVLGIILGKLSTDGVIDLGLQTLQQKYGDFKGELFLAPSFDRDWLTLAFARTALTVTIVAVLETLLSAKIAATMTKTKFNESREVFGLGLANIASGLFGGLPATGVLARTALNVKTGANSRVSSGINALAIGVISLLLFGWFQYIPLPVVAGILLVAAIRMVEAEHLVTLFTFDKLDFLLAVVVAILTVAIDPLIGLLVGAVVALLIAVRRLSRGQSEITIHRHGVPARRAGHRELHTIDDHGDVTVYRFAGELTYFNVGTHEQAIKHIRGCHTLILSLRNVFTIDIDVLQTLGSIITERERIGMQVLLTGVGTHNEAVLKKTHWFSAMQKENRVFPSTTAALTALGFSLSS